MAHLTYGGCYAAFYGTGPPVQVPFVARIAQSLDLPGELRVLDIGCGTGRLLAPLAALGWHVVGMDPQAENLAEARKIADLAPGRIVIVAGGFADLHDIEAFDVVVAVETRGGTSSRPKRGPMRCTGFTGRYVRGALSSSMDRTSSGSWIITAIPSTPRRS